VQASPWVFLARQFKGAMIWLLLGACVISAALGEIADAIAIGAILVLNALVGFFQEYRAERAVLALRAMSAPRARVLRDGHSAVIPAAEVVAGDLLLLEAGDVVAADGRLVEAHALQIVESLLTGESAPVEKQTTATGPETLLADRLDCVFLGTAVATGRGTAEVEATGMRTEMGKIARLLAGAAETETPLQRQLESVGRTLLYLCLGIVAVVSVVVLCAIRIVWGPGRLLAVRNAAIVIVLSAAVGGWKYVDNYRRFGTPLYANGTAVEGFSIDRGSHLPGHYEFTTMRLGGLMRVFGPRAQRGTLTDLPVYHSVPTTLHALAWSDMSFFSEPTRHGDPTHPYPRKRVPAGLIGAVLALGVVPELLAAVGFVVTHGYPRTSPLGQTLGYSVLAVVFALGVVAAAAGDAVADGAVVGGWVGWLRAAPLRMLGRYSYAMYIFHKPLHDQPIFIFTRNQDHGGKTP
jgi:hypothetical protein